MARGTFSPANTFIKTAERFLVGNTTAGELSFAQIQRAHRRKEPEAGDSIQLTDYYLDNGYPDNPDTYSENNNIPTSGNTTTIEITGWQSTKGIRYNTEGYYYIDNDDQQRTITLSHVESTDKDGVVSETNSTTGNFNFGDFTQFNQKIISVTPANIDRIIAANEITGNSSPRSVYRYNAEEIHYDLQLGASGGDEVYYETIFNFNRFRIERQRRGGENSMGVLATNISKSTFGSGDTPKLTTGKVIKTWSFGGRGEAAGVLKYPGDEYAADNFGVGGLAAHRSSPNSLWRDSLRVPGLFKGWRGFRKVFRLLRSLFGFGKKKREIAKIQQEDENGSNFVWRVTSTDSSIDRPGILVGKERNFRRGEFQNFNLDRFTMFME